MKELDQSIRSAPSGVPHHWYAIDWQRVERNVRGMQVRIAKATREGDWRKVKALQRMLTRSLCGKMLAVRRVTENQGKRTAGVDRVLWNGPERKWKAIGELKRRGYRIQAPAITEGLYPQGQREGTPTGYSDHAR